MEGGQFTRLTSYTILLPDFGSGETISQNTFAPLNVYGCPGKCRWHAGRVDMKGGYSLSLKVRDMGPDTGAVRCWGNVMDVIRKDGWGPTNPGTDDTRQASLMRTFGRAVVKNHAPTPPDAGVSTEWRKWIDSAPGLRLAFSSLTRNVRLRDMIDGILDDYDRSSHAQARERYKPERTQGTLQRLENALAELSRDPIALEYLDTAQNQLTTEADATEKARIREVYTEALQPTGLSVDDLLEGRVDPEARRSMSAYMAFRGGLSQPLKRAGPPGYELNPVTVQARELSERLQKIVAKAVEGQAAAVRRGRKQQLALRKMIRALACIYEVESTRQATAGTGRGIRVGAAGKTGQATKARGGGFRRFLAAVTQYGAALYRTPAPTVGDALLRSVLKEHHAQPRWALFWGDQIG